MPEYIERSALLRTLSKEVEYNDDGDQEINSDTVFIAIESAPAADVAEVVHGRWIRGGADDMHGFDFHCSECNKSFHLGSLATIYDVEREWIHCPSCGACMIGGEDDGKTD